MTMQTFTGIEYLKIDVANNFGLDKEDWDFRINWFDEAIKRGGTEALHGMIRQAEEPALFYAGVRAYEAACLGEATGYPISLDATASGIQLLAVLTGDRSAAQLCNVVDTGKRQDAYTGLYQVMLDKIGEGAKIDRKGTKEAIMTAFYNSTAVPKRIFGEGELLDIFYKTMAEQAPGAWELNETMLAIWDEKALVNDWVLPDNFHVWIKVMGSTTESVNFLNQPFDVTYSQNMPIKGGRSLGANMIHSVDGMIVRELARRCMYDPLRIEKIRHLLSTGQTSFYSGSSDKDKMVLLLWDHYQDSGFLSARILDYITGENIGCVDPHVLQELLDSLPVKPFEVLSVHDCFRVLPNYGNDIRQQYNRVLHEIGRSNMLSFLISQILKRKITVQKLDETMAADILESNYALS